MASHRAIAGLADRLLDRLAPAVRAEASCPPVDDTFCVTDRVCATGTGRQLIRVHGTACRQIIENSGCC